MRRNEFTHIPIKKQTADDRKNPNELDIEFLEYEEVETPARPVRPRRPQPGGEQKTRPQRTQTAQRQRPVQQKQAAGETRRVTGERNPQQRTSARTGRPSAGRPTASRPEPRLQHPAGTAQRPVRPQQRKQEEADIEFFDYEDTERLSRLAKEEQRQQRREQIKQQRQGQPSQRQTQARTPQRQGRQTTQAVRPGRAQTGAQAKQAEKRTKGAAQKSTFRKGLTIAWLAFCVILAAALVLLTVFLSNYEKSRPTDMIHRIVSAVEKGDLEDLHLSTEDGTSLADGTILADPASIASFIKQKEEASEDGITYRVVNAESDENKKVYLIRADDQKLLKTVIERSEKKYAFGFTGWQEKETILLSDAFPVTTLKVQIPQSDTLMVNGKTIGPEYLVSEGDRISLISRLIAEGFIGEQPTMDTYEVPGIYFQKEVKATDPSGRTYDCLLTADTYTGGFDASQEFIDEQYDRVIDMFEPYAFYFSGEAGSGALARIMLDDSPAYNSAISADVSWMQEHSDVEITDKKAENFKKYSDEVFSCDIGFLQTIYQGDEPVKTWDTNMTWIFVRDGDDYYIADFVTKTADEG